MSQESSTGVTSSRFQAIFDTALKSYEKQTKKDITAHPLVSQFQTCDSPSAIIAVLQDTVREFDQARSGDERLTRWLNPTVSVLYAFSATLGEGVGLVFSPAKVVFAGIGVFLLAAKDVSASRDAVVELFKRIESFFKRLEVYTEVTPTAAMTDMITQIMVEVLTIFGIATKEIKQGRGKRFLKKLAGRTDIEDALKRLDRLTQEEARMAVAEVLKIAHIVREQVIDEGKEARMTAMESKLVIHQTASNVDEIKWNQLQQILRTWLSPSDSSTNHNIALSAQHEGTSVWFIQSSLFVEWKSTSGSLLWIHGKPGSGKSIICSSIIQDVTAICETGPAIMAYFYFDFRDLKKQSRHDLLLSLVTQLSTSSSSYCDILNRVYTAHKSGARQPSDETLKGCLEEMLKVPGQGPIFIILDALDECPNSPGIPSPRNQVLQLVKDLVNLRLQNLHICVTSRPEVDIRSVLKPLAFQPVSLHDESGQKTDIAEYVRSIVNSSPNMAMRRWRADDKKLVIETLTERADGMFRWVFCQLDALQHCFPPNIRQFLNELPETLDETYERILRGINKAQNDDAHRLLQCLAIAIRPLRVEELAELLAFDFQASSSGGIPNLKEDWRWDNQEEAVLSTCSSLITVVRVGDSQVVQFSHFSVKEYLTSPRLAHSNEHISRFHIHFEPAHTILAQACLGTLLRLDEDSGNGNDVTKGFPLAGYSARHWVDHAQFGKVSSLIQDGMDDLFDLSKPHFAAWIRVYNIDEDWSGYSPGESGSSSGSPLYYAAFCGFYDLAERLIAKHPEHVQSVGGLVLAPLQAALRRKHFRVADLLHQHGAAVDIRNLVEFSSLHSASVYGLSDIVLWLLNHNADVNDREIDGWTPLHLAANNNHLEVIQVLLNHDADINSRNDQGIPPLYYAITGNRDYFDAVQLLLERGADANARGSEYWHQTPLQVASHEGRLEAVGLLLKYGANVDEKDSEGMTPLQIASTQGHHKITKLLSEHSPKPEQ